MCMITFEIYYFYEIYLLPIVKIIIIEKIWSRGRLKIFIAQNFCSNILIPKTINPPSKIYIHIVSPHASLKPSALMHTKSLKGVIREYQPSLNYYKLQAIKIDYKFINTSHIGGDYAGVSSW